MMDRENHPPLSWLAGSHAGQALSSSTQGSKNAQEVNRTVNAFAIWFLNKHLKGSTDPMPGLQDYPRVFNFKQK